MNRGTLTILLCGVVAVVSYTLGLFGLSGPYDALYYVSFAGLIGSFTNKMAIDAMFSPWPSRRLRLPYTGIIERKREEIIEGIAVAVSEEIMAPAAVARWMAENGFLETVRDEGAEQVLSLCEKEGDAATLRIAICDSLRRDAVSFLDSDDAYSPLRALAEKGVQEFLTEKGGLAMQFGQMIAPADYDVMTGAIRDGIKVKVEAALQTENGEPTPEVRSLIEGAASRLKGWDIRSDTVAQRLASAAVQKFDVRSIVTQSLGEYSAMDVKELLVSLSRHHLTWLEVYGGVFGAVGGSVMWLLSRRLL